MRGLRSAATFDRQGFPVAFEAEGGLKAFNENFGFKVALDMRNEVDEELTLRMDIFKREEMKYTVSAEFKEFKLARCKKLLKAFSERSLDDGYMFLYLDEFANLTLKELDCCFTDTGIS